MIKLRQYQEEGLAAIWNYFDSGGKGNPLLAWPTGTGKSIVPAIFIHEIMKIWPNQRFLMMTHVSELIKQNSEVMRLVWPNAPLGIYSAGLGHKQSQLPVVFGGIQSMIKNPSTFGWRDIGFIDEAHLVSDEDNSMYLTFIATMRLINPNFKVVGMTATPFRMGMGLLTEGKLFTDIVHDLTGLEQFNRMIEEGWLCPLVPRRTNTELDVSSVGMSKGDYIGSQLQSVVDKREITFAGLKELVSAAQNRRSWLIFASGIEHAEHIAEMLNSFGVDCAPVHSKRAKEWNDGAIKAFKDYRLRSIVNYSKLTTGFNHPGIDCIADFRPTMSVALHVQKLGRGTRPLNNKPNCLVLDYARNVPRLGPINDPIIPRKKSGEAGEIPVKICEACGIYNHLKVRYCGGKPYQTPHGCGNEFQFQIKIVPKAGNTEIIRSDQPVVEWFDVDRAIYMKRQKQDKPPYIRATYYCSNGVQTFSENVFPEHSHPYSKHLFHNWWKQRHISEPPSSTQDTLQYFAELKVPKRIRVWANKKHPDILSVEF